MSRPIPARPFWPRSPWRAPICVAFALAAMPAAASAAAGCTLQQIVELPVTMIGSKPTVTVGINGQQERFMIDSGAGYSVIGPKSAARLGLRITLAAGEMRGVGGADFNLGMATVGQFTLGRTPLKNIVFLVSPGIDGDVIGVLGENILGLADVEYDLANNKVRLFQPQGCAGVDLGYWAKGTAAQLPLEHTATARADLDRHVKARAEINGQRISVTFDTGAGRSLLDLTAAARAGVTPTSPGVIDAGKSSGFGPNSINTWLAPFKSFVLGSEQIQNTTIRIGSLASVNTDMLLGEDFFASHRVYIANSQARIYLTYNGGPVFRLDKAGGGENTPSTPPGKP